MRVKKPSYNQRRVFDIFWNNNFMSTNSIIDEYWIDMYNSDVMWVEFHKKGRDKAQYRLKVTFGEKTTPTIWGVIWELASAFSDAEGFSYANTFLAEGMNLQQAANGVTLISMGVSLLSYPSVSNFVSHFFPPETTVYRVIDFELEAIE